MAKKFFALLTAFCLAILFAATVFAKMVTVTGRGATYDDAERDALRLAVEQAVGMLVSSESLSKNNTIINDEIYTRSRGFVNNYEVLDKKIQGNSAAVTIRADVDTSPNSRLMSELTRLGIIERQLRDPKIVVMIPETHIRARIPDPAGETAVIRKLTEAGFTRVTDMGEQRNRIMSVAAMTTGDFQTLADAANADILVVGEAFSEGVGDVGKFIGDGLRNVNVQSCKARLEARIFIVRTGQIIAANGTYGTAADLTEFIAAKKALNNAGEKMGDYIVEKLMGYGAGNSQGLEIVVLASDMSRVMRITKTLPTIRGVSFSDLSSYSGGRAVIAVKYSGTPQSLFEQLSRALDFGITLKEVTYNTISIMTR